MFYVHNIFEIGSKIFLVLEPLSVGEGNIKKYGGDERLYACALKAMVTDWRTSWHTRSPEMNAAFPFGEVQVSTSIFCQDLIAASTCNIGAKIYRRMKGFCELFRGNLNPHGGGQSFMGMKLLK